MFERTIPPLDKPNSSAATKVPLNELPAEGAPLEALQLFNVFLGRQAFKAAFGVEPPPFDDKLPPKYWFDPAAEGESSGSVTYAGLRYDNGSVTFESFMLPSEVASAVNMPGFPVFPPYNRLGPSEIEVSTNGTQFRTLDPEYMATPEEALEILADLQMLGEYRKGWFVRPADEIFDNTIRVRGRSAGEKRDLLLIGNSDIKNFAPRNVGQLMESSRVRLGMYHPGQWKFGMTSGIVFYPEAIQAVPNSALRPVPVPSINLKPGWRVVSGGGMFPAWVQATQPTGGGSEASPEILSLLRENNELLKQLVQANHPAFQ